MTNKCEHPKKNRSRGEEGQSRNSILYLGACKLSGVQARGSYLSGFKISRFQTCMKESLWGRSKTCQNKSIAVVRHKLYKKLILIGGVLMTGISSSFNI